MKQIARAEGMAHDTHDIWDTSRVLALLGMKETELVRRIRRLKKAIDQGLIVGSDETGDWGSIE